MDARFPRSRSRFRLGRGRGEADSSDSGTENPATKTDPLDQFSVIFEQEFPHRPRSFRVSQFLPVRRPPEPPRPGSAPRDLITWAVVRF